MKALRTLLRGCANVSVFRGKYLSGTTCRRGFSVVSIRLSRSMIRSSARKGGMALKECCFEDYYFLEDLDPWS